jgi:long-chain acyl-CoA synthetase
MDARMTTDADLIRNAARAFADREAFRSFGVSLSYRDRLAQANCVTSWLQRDGLDEGDRVAIMMPNLLPYPVCLYGALLGGYVVVGIMKSAPARSWCDARHPAGADSPSAAP